MSRADRFAGRTAHRAAQSDGGLRHRAVARGVRVWTETEVTGIDLEGGRVAGVETTRGGRIATRVVVNASGAWAAETARLAGVEIPVVPLRRQLVSVAPAAPLPEGLPMVIDMSNGFHFRPEARELASPGVLLAWPDEAETPGFKTDFDPLFTEKVFQRARERMPNLVAGATLNASRCRAGLYELTPDHDHRGSAGRRRAVPRQRVQRAWRDALARDGSPHCGVDLGRARGVVGRERARRGAIRGGASDRGDFRAVKTFARSR